MSKATKATKSIDLRAFNWQAVLEHLCAQNTVREAFDKVGLPDLTVRYGSKPRLAVHGWCLVKRMDPDTRQEVAPLAPLTRAKIALTAGADSRPTDVVQAIAHEVVHAAGWDDHSHRFHNALRELVREAYGVDCDKPWSRVYEYDRLQCEDLVAGLPVASIPRGKSVRPKAPTRVSVDVDVSASLAVLAEYGCPAGSLF